MKALVTGVSGFIGPHVVEACLKRGWEVVGIDKLPYPYDLPKGFRFAEMAVEYMEADRMRPPDFLGGVDVVIHLAFVTNIPHSILQPVDTTRQNIEMTARALDWCVKHDVKKFVLATTASLYGNNPTPWKEDMPPEPIEPYSAQKLACESFCRMWSACYGLPTVALRLFQVFGENQRPDTAMAAFFRAKIEGKAINLTETTAQSSFRTGQRDFVYVKDVAEAFVLAAETDLYRRGEIVNVGTGRVTMMEDIAKAIVGDDESRLRFIPRRGFEVERHEANIDRAIAMGWKPTTKVLDWLAQFVPTLSSEAT